MTFGENNYSQQKSFNNREVLENDSRGMALMALNEIQRLSNGSSLTDAGVSISLCDLSVDAIRDVLKYVKRETKHTSMDLDFMMASSSAPK